MEKENLFKVTNDTDADEMLTQIRELSEEKLRLEEIAKGRIERIKADLERQVGIINSEISFNESMLQAYFLTVPVKETKVQKTYKLLSGKLVMKKPTIKLVHDDKTLLSWAKDNAAEFIKQEPKLEWSKLKENLVIKDDAIMTKDGEILEVEGLKLEQVNEQFEIKF